MNSLTKLGTALTVVFVICLIALVAQVFCVLWRRRTFRRRSAPATDDLESNSTELFFTTSSYSKELLYFFCWKTQSGRIEPDVNGAPENRNEARSELTDVDEDILAKWQALYGPSRLLFTIKEEERDEAEVDSVTDSCKFKGSDDGNSNSGRNGVKRVCLRECLEEEEDGEDSGLSSEVVMTVVEVGDGTPFSTPCASPQYFTPSRSPVREFNVPEKEVDSPGIGP